MEESGLRITKNRLGILIGYGFHESEARVYLALLEHSSMTAATLSKLAEVPRSHLYKVLHDLQNRGIVEILLQGNARSYRARPIRSFLESRARELRERLDELERDAETVASAFEPPPLDRMGELDAGDVRIIIGRRAVAREIDIMLTEAKDHVLLAGSQAGFERILRHVAPFIEVDAPAPMPRFELILPSGAEEHAWTSRVSAHPHVTLRWLDSPRHVLAVVQDASRVLYVNPIPDTADLRNGRDFAIYSGDRAFAQDYLDLLRRASRDKAGSPGGRGPSSRDASADPSQNTASSPPIREV